MKHQRKAIQMLALLLALSVGVFFAPLSGAEGTGRQIALSVQRVSDVQGNETLTVHAALLGYPAEYSLQWQLNDQSIMGEQGDRLSLLIDGANVGGRVRLQVRFTTEEGTEQTDYSNEWIITPAELTAEATAEATAESQATPEATAEATAESQAAPEATAEAPAESQATPEATAEATAESQATPEATAEATVESQAAIETPAEAPAAEVTEEEVRAILERNGASVRLNISWGDKAYPELGDPFTVKADIQGYEGLIYTFYWQEKGADGIWKSMPGETEKELHLVVSEQNQSNTWRLMVDVQGIVAP